MSPASARLPVFLIRIAALAGTVGLTALIVEAVRSGDFAAAGSWLTGHPWGLVTLGDLYFGFLVTAVFIAGVERDWRRALLWILPLPLLGNIWAGLWLCLRARHVWHRLRGGTDREMS